LLITVVVRIIGTPGKYDQRCCKNKSALFILLILHSQNWLGA